MSVAVLDIGKTNLKIHLFDDRGGLVAERSRPNRSLPGPPWRHYDLGAIEDWLFATLAGFAREHPVAAFVAACHGSGGVLVDADGPVLPAIDYENEVPAEIAREYRALIPPFPACGAPIQVRAGHFAQQMLLMQRSDPAAFARARHFLPLPQYWAWRMTGCAVHEPTMLGAQSQLINPLDRSSTGIVEACGWQHLMAPVVAPSEVVGTVRPGLGLPEGLQVLAGIHDSTANLFGYQAAGLVDFALLSTGTWLVGMCPTTPVEALDAAFGMTVTNDAAGRPVAGVLGMGGREYAAITGGLAGTTSAQALEGLIGRGCLALPGFVDYDGIFPGSAGRGRIEGEPGGQDGRIALATLYNALVADIFLDLMRSTGQVVVDGGFTADPAFAALVAALRPGQEVLVNRLGGGTAAGAAQLWTHVHRGQPVRLGIEPVSPLPLSGLSGLAAYRRRWRQAVAAHIQRPLPPSCSGLSPSNDQE
ncbi:FGGY family carbohydrate kinase [Geminicoccus roseus]|uniref:FGGY family carbohydrate kinase n=1 Tax=Geminicoccus roseus TaxID=404900 RepID=UPI0004270696|nr:FGGY family carbohydrate kinase [Geminicoccus roseus]